MVNQKKHFYIEAKDNLSSQKGNKITTDIALYRQEAVSPFNEKEGKPYTMHRQVFEVDKNGKILNQSEEIKQYSTMQEAEQVYKQRVKLAKTFKKDMENN